MSRLRDILDTAAGRLTSNPSRDPLFPDAFCKCTCGATLRTRLDFITHTAGAGVCLATTSGIRSRVDPLQLDAPGGEW